ncbi:MAG: hypothetical protein AB4911_24340 [Oscillochloridaceae bacterium umkhey_bin13]
MSTDPNAETFYLAARAALSAEQRLRFLDRALACDPRHADALAYQAQLRRLNAPLTPTANANPSASAKSSSQASLLTGMIALGVVGALFVIALMSSQEFAARREARVPTSLPPTVRPIRTSTPTPRPMQTPTPRPTQTATPEAVQVYLNTFAPAGTLTITSSNTMPLVGYPEQMRDAAINVRWTNPTVLNNETWDMTLMFRMNSEPTGYRLALISNGTWRLYLDPRDEPVAQGTVPLRNTSGAENHLELFVIDDQGWLVVNDQFVALLPLMANQSPGFVFLTTGFFDDTRVAGRSLAYRDLTVTSLSDRVGPFRGDLVKTTDGQVAMYDFDTSPRDLFVSSLFSNPTQVETWDYGVTFRETGTAQYRLILQFNGVWQLVFLRDGNYSRVQEGTWLPRERNRLQMIATGSTGWLVINGRFEDRLNLSDITTNGIVSLGAGFFVNDSLTLGERIRFEDAMVIDMPSR